MRIENGIPYSDTQESFIQEKVRFKAEYVPTGDIVDRAIWLDEPEDIHSLLYYWNSKGEKWRYYI